MSIIKVQVSTTPDALGIVHVGETFDRDSVTWRMSDFRAEPAALYRLTSEGRHVWVTRGELASNYQRSESAPKHPLYPSGDE